MSSLALEPVRLLTHVLEPLSLALALKPLRLALEPPADLGVGGRSGVALRDLA